MYLRKFFEFILTRVHSKSVGEGMVYSFIVAEHQRMIEMLLCYFWGAYIFIYSLRHEQPNGFNFKKLVRMRVGEVQVSISKG